MSDKLTEALRAHQVGCGLCTLAASPAHTREVMLSLPGIVVVDAEAAEKIIAETLKGVPETGTYESDARAVVHALLAMRR